MKWALFGAFSGVLVAIPIAIVLKGQEREAEQVCERQGRVLVTWEHERFCAERSALKRPGEQ